MIQQLHLAIFIKLNSVYYLHKTRLINSLLLMCCSINNYISSIIYNVNLGRECIPLYVYHISDDQVVNRSLCCAGTNKSKIPSAWYETPPQIGHRVTTVYPLLITILIL